MNPLVAAGIAGGAGGLLSGIGSVLGGFGARRRASLIKRETKRLLRWASEAAGAERRAFEYGPDYRGAMQFWRQLATAGVSPDAWRVAAESRGLAYGGAPMLAEAGYVSGARGAAYQQLLALSQLPLEIESRAWQLRYAQSGLQQGVPSMVGPSPLELAGQALSSFIQGASGAAQAGIGLYGLGRSIEQSEALRKLLTKTIQGY